MPGQVHLVAGEQGRKGRKEGLLRDNGAVLGRPGRAALRSQRAELAEPIGVEGIFRTHDPGHLDPGVRLDAARVQAQGQPIPHAQDQRAGHRITDDRPDDARFATRLRRPSTGDVLDVILQALVGTQVEPLIGHRLTTQPGKDPRRLRRPHHAVQVFAQRGLQQGPYLAVERLEANPVHPGGCGKAQVRFGHAGTLEGEVQSHLDDRVHQQRAASQQRRGQDHAQAKGEQDLPMASGAAKNERQRGHG